MLSTAALATVANPYAVPPLQPNVVGPGGAYWAPPPPPQQLSSDEPAVATKKKGGAHPLRKGNPTLLSAVHVDWTLGPCTGRWHCPAACAR